MRPYFLYLLAIFLLPISQAKTVIPVATESSYPPYSTQKGDLLEGFYVDMIQRINENMPDYKIDLVPMTWPEALSQMKKGDLPAVLGSYYHGHDWDFLYPFSLPILYETVILVCHKDSVSQSGLNWPDDFTGKLVSNINGYDGWLNNNVRAKSVTDIVNFIEVPNINTAWKMVNAQNVDCTLFEERALASFNKPDHEHINVAAKVTTESMHIGFSNHSSVSRKWPTIATFRQQLDNAIYLSKKQLQQKKQ